MDIEIIDLNDEQTKEIVARLDEYERKRIVYDMFGSVSIGVLQDGVLVAGAKGRMTAYKIFYLSDVFIDEDYRGKGIGRKLVERIEKRALSLGANLIRLDTFHRDAAEFYKKLGYELSGKVENEIDGYCEHIFSKRIYSIEDKSL